MIIEVYFGGFTKSLTANQIINGFEDPLLKELK